MLKLNVDEISYQNLQKFVKYEEDETYSKYNLILEFINHCFNLNLTRLTALKTFCISDISEDNIELSLKTYKYKLESELYINIDDLRINIRTILKDCLKSIRYNLVGFLKDEKQYVSIRN